MRAAGTLTSIPLAKLELHPRNPRTNVGDVSELAASIKANGVLEPILVVQENGGYLAVAGSRRIAAARKAGLVEIPAILREMSDVEASAAALVENLQRKDLDPLEEAEGYKSWLELTGKSQKDLATAVGKDPSTISNALRLLDAPAPVKDALARGDITAAHARIALALPAELVPALELKKGVRTDDLEDQANELKRAAGAVAKIRKAIETPPEGITVTWREGEQWIGNARVDLAKVLGKPPKAIVGNVSGSVDVGNYYVASGNIATHDKLCVCRAATPNGRGDLERVCISPSGFKKYRAELAKTIHVRRTGAVKKKVVSRAAKQAAKARDLKQATKDAKVALAGKAMHYHRLKLAPDARLLKGGPDGEPARLALFGLVSKHSDGLRAKTWRLEVWHQIQELPIKDVREQVTRWAVALAVQEIQDDRHARRELQAAVNAHYKAGHTR